jgi:hypothetical protein
MQEESNHHQESDWIDDDFHSRLIYTVRFIRLILTACMKVAFDPVSRQRQQVL